jgi:hypothetical protein
MARLLVDVELEGRIEVLERANPCALPQEDIVMSTKTQPQPKYVPRHPKVTATTSAQGTCKTIRLPRDVNKIHCQQRDPLKR